jgi:SAM-dependent methyltransferase
MKITGRHLDGESILDFGCGYGRIMRLAYYFSDEDQVYGVDPWDRSVEICRADGLARNVFLSDYLPTSLPVPKQFGLIYSFSVFTHLSKRTTLTCLKTLANYIKPDGLIAITLRPVEFWETPGAAHVGQADAIRLANEHRESGFSFKPHPRSAVDGEITFGDTSMTVEWLQGSTRELRVVSIDTGLSDPYQIYVYLQRN